MEKYLLIPLDETVVFPGMTVTMPLDTASEARVLLVPRHEGTYAKVGTVAEVVETGRLPGGGQVATLGRLVCTPDVGARVTQQAMRDVGAIAIERFE